MRKTTAHVLACIAVLLTAPAAHGDLAAGSVSLIGFRADATDGLALATWVELPALTTLTFWDSGYIGGGDQSGQGAGGGNWRRSGEDLMTWTPSATIAAGTVIVFSFPNSGSATVDVGGTLSGSLNGLSAEGDQIFVGQGTFSSSNDSAKFQGTLLFGLDFNGSAGWDSTASNAQTSRLPGALAGANFSIAHVDNAEFNGLRTGATIAQYLTAVTNSSNWRTDNNDSNFGSLNSSDFVIAAVPEPAAYLFGGIVCGVIGLGLAWRRAIAKIFAYRNTVADV